MNGKSNIQYIQVEKGGTREVMPKCEKLKERDRPYRPTPDDRFFGNGVCKCGAVFLTKDTKFCGNCGQRLDWSEDLTNEYEKN